MSYTLSLNLVTITAHNAIRINEETLNIKENYRT